MSSICIIAVELAAQADDDPPQRSNTHPGAGRL